MNVRPYDRDIAKAAEDFFQKITGLEPMPNRWPVYDFKGRPFMGFDGRPIQVKGSDFHQHERYPKAGQWQRRLSRRLSELCNDGAEEGKL